MDKPNIELNLQLDENQILHKEFEGTKPGYNSLQVDAFLDMVISDYQKFETYRKNVEQALKDANNMITLLNNKLNQTEAKLAVCELKIENIDDNNLPSLSNIDYLKRISALEAALHKAGIDPNKI